MVDSENPRFDVSDKGQRSAIHAMVVAQGEKLYNLARDIVKNGLSLGEALIVMPAPDHPNRYIVLEGNRRTTVLKILTSPELIRGIVDESSEKRYAKLSEEFRNDPITEMPCTIVDSRGIADHSIRRRHGGDLNGAGISPWGAKERQRYLSTIRNSVPPPALQIFDWVSKQGVLSDNARTQLNGRWFTNLERMISDVEVRRILGLSINNEDGRIETQYNQTQTLAVLSSLVEKLSTGEITVNNLRTPEQRVQKIQQLVTNHKELLKESEILPIPIDIPPINELDSDDTRIDTVGTIRSSPGRKSPIPRSGNRLALIPKKYKIGISRTKTNNIYHELRTLPIDKYPNAVSVMFRVFLDLSVTEYVRRAKLSNHEASLPNQKLRDKLKQTADYFEQQGIMSAAELHAVRHTAEDQRVILALQTFNSFVHEPTFEPIVSDLKTMWDNLAPFLETVWRHMPDEQA